MTEVTIAQVLYALDTAGSGIPLNLDDQARLTHLADVIESDQRIADAIYNALNVQEEE